MESGRSDTIVSPVGPGPKDTLHAVATFYNSFKNLSTLPLSAKIRNMSSRREMHMIASKNEYVQSISTA
jgi:hypothetical protein